jgi:hypothetical protein
MIRIRVEKPLAHCSKTGLSEGQRYDSMAMAKEFASQLTSG